MRRAPPVTDGDVRAATELATRAMHGVFLGGRPLAGGDAHVAVLTTAGLSPVEAIVLYAGWQDTVSRRFLQATRLWDDEVWEAAVAGLARRGLVDDQGLTNAGMAYRQDIEDRTDAASTEPWERLGDDTLQLHRLLRPIAVAVAAGYPRPPAIPASPDA